MRKLWTSSAHATISDSCAERFARRFGVIRKTVALCRVIRYSLKLLAMKRYVTEVLAVATVYFLTARLGLMVDPVSGFATLVWPPTGIAIAALTILGRRVWPAIAVAAFFANFTAGAPFVVALAIAVGNTCEAVLGSYALRPYATEPRSLTSVRNVIVFLLMAAFLSPIVSAATGVVSLHLGGIVSVERVAPTFQAWWLGDVSGALIVAPLILLWRERDPAAPYFGLLRAVEILALTLLLCSVIVILGDRDTVTGAYLLFLPMIWAAFRFGPRGVVTTMFAISVATILGTAYGHGPFAYPGIAQSLVSLQAFLAVTATTFLVLGASFAERRELLAIAQHNHESEQYARARAEAAVRARDEFISIASHELRTPLSALRLHVDMLQAANEQPRSGEEQRARITMVGEKLGRQVRRLTGLVDGLLDVSRIATGKLQVELEEVDLAWVIRDVVARYDVDLHREQIQLSVDLPPAILGYWDPLRLDQVVSNLLSNALKYGQGRAIEISATADDERVVICVRDYGVGIAEADQERIFDRFERISPQESVVGFGLGLWIVRRIVDALGGTIRLESALGQGSTFTVDLPRFPAGTAPTPEARAKIMRPLGDEVLVVEDDHDILEAITELIRSHGYRVAGALNGQEALEYLRDGKPPALILLDLTMPVMNGAEFLRAAREGSALAATPVVLLSADSQLPKRAAELEVADYIRKPIDLDQLVALLERHCGESRDMTLQ